MVMIRQNYDVIHLVHVSSSVLNEKILLLK